MSRGPRRDPVGPPVGGRPSLIARHRSGRVRVEEPGTGAWLTIDAENVFDPRAINDLP